MKENTNNSSNPEKKDRLTIWLYPSTLNTIDKIVKDSGIKSRSYYLEKAALFYAGYIATKNTDDFLPAALTQVLKVNLEKNETHITRILFKLAVEMSMMMNVLASELDIPLEDLDNLKIHCIKEVKKTSGNISFSEAVKFQNPE